MPCHAVSGLMDLVCLLADPLVSLTALLVPCRRLHVDVLFTNCSSNLQLQATLLLLKRSLMWLIVLEPSQQCMWPNGA